MTTTNKNLKRFIKTIIKDINENYLPILYKEFNINKKEIIKESKKYLNDFILNIPEIKLNKNKNQIKYILISKLLSKYSLLKISNNKFKLRQNIYEIISIYNYLDKNHL